MKFDEIKRGLKEIKAPSISLPKGAEPLKVLVRPSNLIYLQVLPQCLS